MFDKFREIDWHPDGPAIRQFGRVLLIGCPLTALAWYCLVRWFSGEWVLAVPIWITGIGWAIGLLAFISRALALPFYLLWFFLVAVIDTVVTNTLFISLFYLVISPVALLMKLLGRDPLARRIEPERETYFLDAPKAKGPESYYNQF